MATSTTKKSPLDAAFGRTLNRLRVDRDLSQEELAFECKLHRTYISQLERGLKTPSLQSVFTIARTLGVSASEFVREVENELGRRG